MMIEHQQEEQLLLLREQAEASSWLRLRMPQNRL